MKKAGERSADPYRARRRQERLFMAKRTEPAEPKWTELTIELSPQSKRMLTRLLKTGLYGRSLSEVVTRLIDAKMIETFLDLDRSRVSLSNRQ